jgi:hypothetical protein
VNEGKLAPKGRQGSLWGILPALIMFAIAAFAGPFSLWCYIGSMAWYWFWLMQRGIPPHPVPERNANPIEGREDEVLRLGD